MNEGNKKLISLILGGVSLLLSVVGFILMFMFAASGWLALAGIIIGLAAVIFSASVSKENGKNGAVGMLMGLGAVLIGIIVSIGCLICNCTCGGTVTVEGMDIEVDNYYAKSSLESIVEDQDEEALAEWMLDYSGEYTIGGYDLGGLASELEDALGDYDYYDF